MVAVPALRYGDPRWAPQGAPKSTSPALRGVQLQGSGDGPEATTPANTCPPAQPLLLTGSQPHPPSEQLSCLPASEPPFPVRSARVQGARTDVHQLVHLAEGELSAGTTSELSPTARAVTPWWSLRWCPSP